MPKPTRPTLSTREARLVRLVRHGGFVTGRDVAIAFQAEYGESMPYSALYQTFSELEEQGLVVQRDDDVSGRRVRSVKVTPKGLEALAKAGWA